MVLLFLIPQFSYPQTHFLFFILIYPLLTSKKFYAILIPIERPRSNLTSLLHIIYQYLQTLQVIGSDVINIKLMFNLRLQIYFKNLKILTNVGCKVYLLSNESYLRILNSVQLIKVNISNNQPLKIGQSFYIYFHFTNHYLAYDSHIKSLVVTKNELERTEFKILTDQFDWNSRGQIQMGPLFKYRIILAEHNSRVLSNNNGSLISSQKQDQNSLVSFEKSVYFQEDLLYPVRLYSLQSELTISYLKNKLYSKKKASFSEFMFSLWKKDGGPQCTLRHLFTNSYLVKSGSEFIFMKNAPDILKFCFTLESYDEKGQYLILKTLDQTYLWLNTETNKFEGQDNYLQNILVKQKCRVEQINNIVLSAWLKAELSLPADEDNIFYILQECQNRFLKLRETYEINVVETLIAEGILEDLNMAATKYDWENVGERISNIIKYLLMIKKNWIHHLFKTPFLYSKMMNNEEVVQIIKNFRIIPEELQNPLQILASLKKLIFQEREISLSTLQTLLFASPLINSYGHLSPFKQIKDFVDFSCQKIVPQLQKRFVSSFFSIGMKIVKQNTKGPYFSSEVMNYLSLNILQDQNFSLEDKLTTIQVFKCQSAPYIYIATQNQYIRCIAHEKKNEQTITYFLEQILPKNCKFETYENKMISIFLLSYHLKIIHVIQLHDCKQYFKFIMDSISTYNYEEAPELFFRHSLNCFYELINKVFIISCQRILLADQLEQLDLQQKIEKSKQELEPFLNQKFLDLSSAWNIFQPDSILSEDSQDIFLLLLKITESIVCSSKKIEYYFSIIKLVEEPEPNLIKILSLFLQRQHQFNPIQASNKLIETCQYLNQEQYIILTTLINQNDLYEKLCYKTQAFYKSINCFATEKVRQRNILDANKILSTLQKRKQQQWIYSNSQFTLLQNLLNMIGGVVTTQIYEFYNKYICNVPPQKWTLHYFKLCTQFFNMSPSGLKKRFVVNYHSELKSINVGQSLDKLFINKDSEFILSYINLLLGFADYHISKQLIYQILGDEILFKFLNQFPKNIELRTKIFQFMIRARKRYNQFEAISASHVNIFWLKKGTTFIRQKLNIEHEELSSYSELSNLKQFTTVLIRFLSMRQQITQHTEISEDESLVVEGTNKIFAFKVAQLIGLTVKRENIDRELYDLIQWFEKQYKIGIDTIQLTQISAELQKNEKNSENFQYNYMLTINPLITTSMNVILGKIKLEVFVTIILKIILSTCFKFNARQEDLIILLNHLHYIASYKNHQFDEKKLELLFLIMRQLMCYKKRNLVALIQNIIRKAIMRDGHIDHEKQVVFQKSILKYKGEMFEFFSECLSNYCIFSPLYLSTLNYFNANGQKSVCWTVSCYVSFIRFLIGLSKSLELRFKEVFSETQNFSRELIGIIIEINQHHIGLLQKDTSDAKLTIIAYEIQLINNLMLGPVDRNIETALKFKYDKIIDLLNLPDHSNEPEREKTFRIILYLKTLVAQSIQILVKFKQFSAGQRKKIQQSLIINTEYTASLVNDNIDLMIEKYKKKYKHTLQVMSFQLCINVYFSLVKIYEIENDKKIKMLCADAVRKKRLRKSYSKRFKIFYQLYQIVAQIFEWIGRCIISCVRSTANEIDKKIGLFGDQNISHEEKLDKVLDFYVRNVATVDIQVGDKIETIFFLLMMETKYYNNSIRKQLHRKVGLGDRDFRLANFVAQANHVIQRLQIQRAVRKFTEKYKPLQLIVKNRQLWKSMNFFCACLLNLIFLAGQILPDYQVPMNILRSMVVLFCIFLYMIYFIQNLPLKRRLAKNIQNSQNNKKFKKIKGCLQILNDKTLWFATIYFLVIWLSLYQQGFVALLMIDFFVRFKISKKVTEIITRPIFQLFLIVLVSVQLAFVYTYYQYFIGQTINCENTPTCIQQTYYQYLGIYKNNVAQFEINKVKFRDITQFFSFFISIMITNSLIISVLLYEKKSKDLKQKEWQFKVKQKCFICDQERNVVDRARNNNKGFYQHIEEEHNLWNYIFYLIYLRSKQIQNLNIVESMVLNQWKEIKIDWLPKTFKM